MERIEELFNSCFKPSGKFHFRKLTELTAFVIEQGGILYPDRIHYSFGSFTLTYLIDDPDDKEVAKLIRESDFQFQEVTELYLEQVRKGDIRRQFLTQAGDAQFFYFDGQKERLFLISHILE